MSRRVIQRGVEKTWTLKVPFGSWTSGDRILFGMKQRLDTDPTDANAKMKKSFSDESITETTAEYKVFTLVFTEDDTVVPAGTYHAAFKYIDVNGKETEYPQFDVTVELIVNNREA